MATPTLAVIEAIHQTRQRLNTDSEYAWSHLGSCNCGHLTQTITQKSKAEIHALALQKAGDWQEHIVDYCPESGYPIDHIIAALLSFGFTRQDLIHLERLSDKEILAKLTGGKRELNYRLRSDVIAYLDAWLKLLSEQWAEQQELPDYILQPGVSRRTVQSV